MASDPDSPPHYRKGQRFHGRVEAPGRPCAAAGCDEPGEFRAPPEHGGVASDTPASWRWLCLEHVRAFNAGYNYFTGMSADEIAAAQRPYAGWERETRAFSTNAESPPPKWADFEDPLDAIGARFQERMAEARAAAARRKDGKPLSAEDRKSLKILGLGADAGRTALRKRYLDLVRQYHPDRNGGDRSFEAKLQAVIAAYQHLRKAPAFA